MSVTEDQMIRAYVKGSMRSAIGLCEQIVEAATAKGTVEDMRLGLELVHLQLKEAERALSGALPVVKMAEVREDPNRPLAQPPRTRRR
jgi:energy-coupling factor transporter ATP-binding protein EcfA2